MRAQENGGSTGSQNMEDCRIVICLSCEYKI